MPYHVGFRGYVWRILRSLLKFVLHLLHLQQQLLSCRHNPSAPPDGLICGTGQVGRESQNSPQMLDGSCLELTQTLGSNPDSTERVHVASANAGSPQPDSMLPSNGMVPR